jgi:hypothetical protein
MGASSKKRRLATERHAPADDADKSPNPSTTSTRKSEEAKTPNAAGTEAQDAAAVAAARWEVGSANSISYTLLPTTSPFIVIREL